MQPWIFTLIPVSAAILGSAVAAYRKPGPIAVGAIQHFAAGVIFAAAAGEILPDLKHAGSPWYVLIGGGIGILMMLLLKQVELRVQSSLALVAIVGLDILIDGLVLGLGFTASEKTGLLLTIALTIEIFFLGLTVAVDKPTATPIRVIGVTVGLVLLLPLGVVLAAPIAAFGPAYRTAFFAFSLMALLYLVTEELLVEAHKTPDRPWVAAMFFVGFLILLSIEEITG